MMKKTKNEVMDILFDAYAQGNAALNSDAEKSRDEIFFELHRVMEKAGVDNEITEMITNLNYVTMEAAFYAGFKAAESLLSV